MAGLSATARATAFPCGTLLYRYYLFFHLSKQVKQITDRNTEAEQPNLHSSQAIGGNHHTAEGVGTVGGISALRYAQKLLVDFVHQARLTIEPGENAGDRSALIDWGGQACLGRQTDQRCP